MSMCNALSQPENPAIVGPDEPLYLDGLSQLGIIISKKLYYKICRFDLI